MKKSLFPGILLLSLWGLSARAAPALDQEFAPAVVNGYATLDDQTRAQTFTVGAAGLLSQFEVLISASSGNSWLFEIHSTVAGAPVLGSAALASGTITYGANEDPTFYGADISAFGIIVSPGDVLAIVAPGKGGGSSDSWWTGSNSGDLYAGGQYYTTFYTGSPPVVSSEYSLQSGWDLGFRTYVDSGGAAPIPAPGAVLLASVGLACIASRRLR
jgi:hypothetical protein